jgi:transcription initiation factor TFIIE subunit alpha
MVLQRLIEITEEIIGDEAAQVVEYLYSNPGASEFDISESIGFTVSQIRSILYELKAKNLIDYDRRKDKEKGWYLYYWRVLPNNFEKVYLAEKRSKLNMFKERLQKEEESVYYICPNFCKRLPFDEALEENFTCPVCGSLMNEENKERKIQILKRNIKEHEEFVKELEASNIEE